MCVCVIGDFVRTKDRCGKCKGQRIFDKETKISVRYVFPAIEVHSLILYRFR